MQRIAPSIESLATEEGASPQVYYTLQENNLASEAETEVLERPSYFDTPHLNFIPLFIVSLLLTLCGAAFYRSTFPASYIPALLLIVIIFIASLTLNTMSIVLYNRYKKEKAKAEQYAKASGDNQILNKIPKGPGAHARDLYITTVFTFGLGGFLLGSIIYLLVDALLRYALGLYV